MPFLGFRADFNPPKEGHKLARNPPKRHNVIERRLKIVKKCVDSTASHRRNFCTLFQPSFNYSVLYFSENKFVQKKQLFTIHMYLQKVSRITFMLKEVLKIRQIPISTQLISQHFQAYL